MLNFHLQQVSVRRRIIAQLGLLIISELPLRGVRSPLSVLVQAHSAV